jgi:hypothetical protein
MVLGRGLAALAAVALIGVTAALGCSGLNASDSNQRCTAEQQSKTACFDDNVFASCVSCYESCGDSCQPQETCPEQYLCPGDTPVDAGSDAL